MSESFKSVNIWQSYKQERGCLVHFAGLANTLLKDEEGARDYHVLSVVVLALVLGLEVSLRTNFESLVLALALKVKFLALALSKSPWRRQVIGQPVNLIFKGTSEPQKP